MLHDLHLFVFNETDQFLLPTFIYMLLMLFPVAGYFAIAISTGRLMSVESFAAP
jgi:hypothetical protein